MVADRFDVSLWGVHKEMHLHDMELDEESVSMAGQEEEQKTRKYAQGDFPCESWPRCEWHL